MAAVATVTETETAATANLEKLLPLRGRREQTRGGGASLGVEAAVASTNGGAKTSSLRRSVASTDVTAHGDDGAGNGGERGEDREVLRKLLWAFANAKGDEHDGMKAADEEYRKIVGDEEFAKAQEGFQKLQEGIAARKKSCDELAGVLRSAVDNKNQCFHGSTREAFENKDYFNILEAFKDAACVKRLKKEDKERDSLEFLAKYRPYLYDEEFGRFVFAVAVECFLRGNDKETHFVLKLGTHIKCNSLVPDVEGEESGPGSDISEKYRKCLRAAYTKRDTIIRLARETENYCNCMKDSKKEAKRSMEKVWFCGGCKKMTPK